jgi:hypothetical protein
MALYRLGCALGQHRLVTVRTRGGLPLPVYCLADEKQVLSQIFSESVVTPADVGIQRLAQRMVQPM